MTDTSHSFHALSKAKTLNLSSQQTVIRDQLGKNHPKSFLQFQFSQRSQLTLSTRSQRSNAQIRLLDQAGRVLQRFAPTQRGTTTVQQTLEPGTYQLQVTPRKRNQSTKYRLALKATPLSSPSSSSSRLAASTGVDKSRFNIRFDYRFDTIGWFTPEKRSALEAAARVWENIILDEFPEVAAGTRTYGLFNPQTGSVISGGFVNDAAIDDLVIFVGARDLGLSGTSPILAQAGPAGTREARITGNQFRPWLGSIAFDLDRGGSPTRWFFDSTPDTANDIPANQIDFISTAVHEIGHVLGFGTSRAFDRLTAPLNPAQSTAKGFVGINARTVNGGNPIPLNGGHIQENYEFGGSGESVMDVKIASGVRTLPTRLDIAILNDIGYTVNYTAAVQNPSSRILSRMATRTQTGLNRLLASAEFGSQMGRLQYRCGCAGCLMGNVA